MTHPTITRAFLESLNFHVMTALDRRGFAGAESPVPLLADFAEKYLVIIDGAYCEIIEAETGEQVDICDDIIGL